MLKVSFIEPYKKVEVFNNKITKVTLTGYIKHQDSILFSGNFPKDMNDWFWNNPYVEFDADYAHDRFIIKTSGHSSKSEEDTFDSVIGERIAEARAKLKVYKFVRALIRKKMQYLYSFMYGNFEIISLLESHSEVPKDCLYLTLQKYNKLIKREREHLQNLTKWA